MLKLRHTLLSNKLYFVILLIVVAISVPRLLVKENSILDTDTKELTGTITNFTFDGNCLTLDLKISRFENTKATYHFKELSELLKIKKVLRLGDKISLTGNTKKPRERSVPNTFDYRHYLRIKHINYLFEGEKIVSLKRNNNVYYMLKNTIYNYINHFKSKSYIKMLLIGDTSEVNKKIIDSFRENGISHLFAISGISTFSNIKHFAPFFNTSSYNSFPFTLSPFIPTNTSPDFISLLSMQKFSHISYSFPHNNLPFVIFL